MSTNGQHPQWLPVDDHLEIELPSKDLLIAGITGNLYDLLQQRPFRTLAYLYYRVLMQKRRELDPGIPIDDWLEPFLNSDPELEFHGWGAGQGEL